MSDAALLVAHGSRRNEANAELVAVAERFAARRPELIVEIAYLELADPDIPSGARACVERGATRVSLLPWFLSPGSHVRGDLERFRKQFSEQYPDVTFCCSPPLGVHDKLIDVLEERLEEGWQEE